MRKKLYFPFVLTIEIGILVAFIFFLIDLFPSLAPQGYRFYGDAAHVPFLEQEMAHIVVTVFKWLFFLLTAGMMLPMMVTIIMELIRWQINQIRNPGTTYEIGNKGDKQQVKRFDNHLRLQHYLIMIGVTIAGVLGLAQAFPDWGIASWFVQVGGGLEGKRQFHHYFAYIVDFTVLYYIGYILHKFFIRKEKMRAAFLNLQDLKDFINMNKYIMGFLPEEPKYDRYTFGQKLDFFIILIGIPCLSITGLLMHYTSFSGLFLSDLGIALCAVIHRGIAIFLAWFVLSVHMYYAHLAPGLFPVNTVILTGKMSKSRYAAMFPLDSERLHESGDAPGEEQD
jgi:formate dehydrogenase subunit gamma